MSGNGYNSNGGKNKNVDLNKNLNNDDIEAGNTNKSSLAKLKFWKKKKSDQNSNINLEKDVKITEHLMEISEVCAKYKSDPDKGIDEKEAAFRLSRDGPNMFTPPKQKAWWKLYLKEMVNGFAILLWFAAIGSVISYFISPVIVDIYVTVLLALVVIITGTFSYYQQAKSSSVFKSFRNMAPPKTTVIREGRKHQIPVDQIVVGDLVYCKSGDRVPADIRIIKCESMKVDNSSLTGESDPIPRSPDIGDQNPLEAPNLAFFSTNCVDGNGFGIAIATGDRTVMGDIAKLVTGIENEKTPIAKEMSRFVKIITVLAIICGIVFFGIGMGQGLNFSNAFLLFIGITVGNVPEGLLPSLTVALTLTAQRLAKKKCMVKNLEAVETLGSTSTICTDKTGTLTQNRMTVEHCWLGTNILKISHKREDVHQQIKPISKLWEAYKRCAILCSRSEFNDDHPDIMKRECSGDASETAILRFMESVEGPVAQYRSKYPKVAEKPFSSTYKYQFSIHHNTDTIRRIHPLNSLDGSVSNFFLVMKGAPERIIKLCKYFIQEDGQTVEMNDKFIEQFEETYRELGSMGERVLALCDHDFTQFPRDYKFNLEDGNDFELENFRFLGLVAMIDPPRETVPGAVAKCRIAGIKVIMVTGDHPITAQAIAKQVGIFSQSHRNSTIIRMPTIDRVEGITRSVVVPGDELSHLTDNELQEILGGFREIVFARTSPQQKLRIVENCQSLGQIVAVTGDGVNDSPALKKADIGIAMGITGSEVSKQAADLVLMDDNFATIVTGVEEGRRIFDNMKKVISYVLTGNIATTWPFVINVIFGLPSPIGTMTCLLVVIFINILPAVALAYEKAESDIMQLTPRNPRTDRLVNLQLMLRSYFCMGIITTLAGINGYMVCLFYEGFKPHMLWQASNAWNGNGLVYRYAHNQSWEGEPTELVDSDTLSSLLIKAQSAYFIGIVVALWAIVIGYKTRRLSIFTQGMGNWILNWSIVISTGIAVLFCYTPGLMTVLRCAPVIGQVWVASLPFVIYILIFEEFAKFFVRRYPKSFLGTELLA